MAGTEVNKNPENYGLKPELVWRFFFDISRIPRCSGNESGIRDYIRKFCERKNLKYVVDNSGNVVVHKFPGNSSKDTGIIFQSHMDMVCEKNSDCTHDFSRDPIRVEVVNGWVRARGTTLGADNGIGVAVMLAMLEEDSDYGFECLFTVEEETGLRGAFELEPGILEGRYLINLDTESEGVIYVGCAGGRDSDMVITVERIPSEIDSKVMKLHVYGFKGGHSGAEIHLGRENAIRAMARILYQIGRVVSLKLVDISGGDKHNAIPRECMCRISVNRYSTQLVRELAIHYFDMIKTELGEFESDIRIGVDEDKSVNETMDYESTKKLINFVLSLPHGVLQMSPAFKGLVQSSTNISSIKTEGNRIRIHSSHRSSSDSALQWIADAHRALSELAGAVINQDAGYPAWQPEPESNLVGIARKAIEKVTGKEAQIRAIHAGLECGILKRRIEGIEAISIGPTIIGAHSPEEKVNIRSVEVLWNVIKEILTIVSKGS